jgi:hypothetical protein
MDRSTTKKSHRCNGDGTHIFEEGQQILEYILNWHSYHLNWKIKLKRWAYQIC